MEVLSIGSNIKSLCNIKLQGKFDCCDPNRKSENLGFASTIQGSSTHDALERLEVGNVQGHWGPLSCILGNKI